MVVQEDRAKAGSWAIRITVDLVLGVRQLLGDKLRNLV
jgi:hypothetical protein